MRLHMSSIKVGLIGCGRIVQQVHLNILTHMSGVDLVALAEVDPERRKQAALRAPGARSFADYRELLEAPEVTAVIICLPNALHAEAAVAAFQKGKSVYLEKPLATNLGDANRVVECWRQADVVGMIGFNYRFHALYQEARLQIDSGRLGDTICGRSVFSSMSRNLPAWKQNRQDGGGVLLDLASHHIDLIHFLFGQRVNNVFANICSQDFEGDSAILQLELDDGLIVQSFFSMKAIDEDVFEIYGDKGKIRIDRYHSLNVEFSDPAIDFSLIRRMGRKLRRLAGSPYLLDKIRGTGREPSYQLALSHFISSVRANRSAQPDILDGLRSLAVVEAAERSARTGRRVLVEDPAK
ncbi:hypothetical protein MNBD_NITROSPINAE02-1149 [hydrothermal vent metagenome]|uniref:Gfo/Idh/MocA family oxidoreductase n=1 Tax=hydrothermal vent metagenome TaxID=652676 RepID=A0A3B1CRW4_9ZZZZ